MGLAHIGKIVDIKPIEGKDKIVIDSKFEDGEWMYEVSPDSGQSGWFSEKELTEA